MTKKILFDLIKIDSRQGKETAIAEYLADLLIKNHYSIYKQEVPQSEETRNYPKRYNLIATIGKPKLFFLGHMDTVQSGDLASWKVTSPLCPLEKDGRIYGLGAVDMKGGIAAALAAALENKSKALGFCFTCDEEYKFLGIKKLVESDYFSRFNPELAVFTEPTDLKIINRHRGCIEIKLDVLGKTAHATRPQEGKDASALYLVLDRLRYDLQEEFGDVNLNIGYFHSGELNKINKVPEISTATIDIRPSDALAKKNAKYIVDMINGRLHDIGLTLSNYNINFDMKPLNVDTSELHRLERIVRQQGNPVIYENLKATSEAGEINFRYGIPCVNFGPGPNLNSHKSDEYVDIASLMRCKEIYAALIADTESQN